MRLLRYVGPGDDGSHVIVETADAGEQFHLLVDVALRDAIRSDLPRLSHVQPESPASVTPREIQMRVRGGESPQDLAETEGMTLERVLRFAGAVLEERARIAGEARRARARRSTTEGQAVVFGEAVDERFAAHGIDPATITWDAYRREDGEWVVIARWIGGDAERKAEWIFHRAARTVTPIDDTAADLLSDRPIRPVVPLPAEGHRPTLTVAPPLAPGVVAFPAMPDAHTGPLPRREEVFDQEATDPEPSRRPAAPASRPTPRPAHAPAPDTAARPSAPTPAPAPVSTPQAAAPVAPSASTTSDYDAPPLPLGLPAPPPATAKPAAPRVTNLGVAHRDEDDDERAARARIPSWDDILLGVRRKGD